MSHSRVKPTSARVAVVDIGSNSIRLVVFDRLVRSLLQVFNEKVMCGLGRGLDKSGRLDPNGVASALENLPRFAAVAAAMNVTKLFVFATAAVREASNGPDFLNQIRESTGFDVRILSGDEEARLSALGVACAIPDADGVVGDLGGGSLELVSIRGMQPGKRGTLPLGAFRLMREDEKPDQLVRWIDRQLDLLPWLDDFKGRTFYPVGGTWRAVARIHMNRVNYPLRVIHHYSIDGRAAAETASLLGSAGRKSLARLKGAPKRRMEALPYGALVLARVLHRLQPRQVVFSSYGVREGIAFEALPAAEREHDPLLETCAEMAASEGRFTLDGDAVLGWMAPLFVGDERVPRQLRLAASWLADVAGLDHPDYRGEHAFLRVLRMPAVGIDHPGRAFLALALLTRYEGNANADFADSARRLLSDEAAEVARLTGLALRLAIAVSAGSTSVLKKTRLEIGTGELRLIVPPRAPGLAGEVVRKRVEDLAAAVGRDRAVIKAA